MNRSIARCRLTVDRVCLARFGVWQVIKQVLSEADWGLLFICEVGGTKVLGRSAGMVRRGTGAWMGIEQDADKEGKLNPFPQFPQHNTPLGRRGWPKTGKEEAQLMGVGAGTFGRGGGGSWRVW